MLEEKYLRSGIDIVEGPGIGRRIVALVVNVTHEFFLFLSLKKKNGMELGPKNSSRIPERKDRSNR